MLLAIGQCADRAVPSVGADLNEKMTGLQKSLVQPVTTDLLTKTNQQARIELSQWADRAFTHHQEVEREVREIISAVSTAAASVSERDARYAREITDLTGHLGAIADAEDLAYVRRSIVESTRALKCCVARMLEDSKSSVCQLTAEVKEYRARMEEAERVSHTDPLTNLANRRAFEKQLEAHIAACKPFCLIMIDLDDFKSVNDRYGHIAGDDLLQQFGAELQAQFTGADLVGRMGGDEFIVLTGGPLSGAEAKVASVRKWALGEYKLRHKDQVVKIILKASVGVAAWDGEEAPLSLVARVDQEVYRAKDTGERR